jgi:hypothetical protein
MTRHIAALGTVAALAAVMPSNPVIALDVTQAQQAAPIIPVKIDVVVSRFQGEKKISSLPYTLFVNANGNSMNLRIGVDVPVGSSVVTSGNENPTGGGRTTTTSSTTNRTEYRNVGTSIDCWARQLPDGRFMVNLRVQDSSIFTADADTRAPLKLADPMAFRTFTFSNELPMRESQPLLWATATDKITGEILKLEATLTVVK